MFKSINKLKKEKGKGLDSPIANGIKIGIAVAVCFWLAMDQLIVGIVIGIAAGIATVKMKIQQQQDSQGKE